MCNHLLKLQRFLEHFRARGAIGMSLKVCLQFKPRFVRLDCLETSFVFCLDPREHESPPLWWCLVNLRIYIYHQKRIRLGFCRYNYTKHIEHLEKIQASQEFLTMLTTRLIDKKKVEFAHFPISPSLHFQHLLSISTVRHAHLQWYQTGSSGAPKHGKNTAAVEFRWNKLRHSSHPSVCASVGDFDMSKKSGFCLYWQ